MFNTAQFAEMTNTDTMFLPRLGLEKRVIFCVIPDNDKTYNFSLRCCTPSFLTSFSGWRILSRSLTARCRSMCDL